MRALLFRQCTGLHSMPPRACQVSLHRKGPVWQSGPGLQFDGHLPSTGPSQPSQLNPCYREKPTPEDSIQLTQGRWGGKKQWLERQCPSHLSDKHKHRHTCSHAWATGGAHSSVLTPNPDVMTVTSDSPSRNILHFKGQPRAAPAMTVAAWGRATVENSCLGSM